MSRVCQTNAPHLLAPDYEAVSFSLSLRYHEYESPLYAVLKSRRHGSCDVWLSDLTVDPVKVVNPHTKTIHTVR